MPKDTLRLLKDYNIAHTTEHHHCTTGWVQVNCPFCTDSDFHLGIPLHDPKIVNCWRCGKHSLFETIKELLHCTGGEAYRILEKYETGISPYELVKKRKQASTLVLPPGTGPLNDNHKRYLIKRGFDLEQLVQEWDILGTGPLGPYKHRIIIPIHHEGRLVSYTGRDITERSDTRYKTCESGKEVRSHKHCLYGLDKVQGNNWVLVVEGPTDVWRIGPGTVATFGITWVKEQVLLLSRFKMASILYDPEPYAQEQALKLAVELNWLGVDTEIIQQHGASDPGDMTNEDVKDLKRRLV